MTGKKVLGLIFSNLHDEALSQLTAHRTMGSVPFCSRYRLIDFPLSSMVNSGITKVGIVTKANYQSLMDHVGTGKPWDLSRKYDGMYLLPPYNHQESGYSASRVDALYHNLRFIRHSKQSHVLMTDCNVVTNLDYRALFACHEAADADITIVACRGKRPEHIKNILVFDRVDAGGRLLDASIDPQSEGDVLYSTNIMIARKSILESLISNANSYNQHHFQKDIIMGNLEDLHIQVYVPDAYTRIIDSLQGYFDISMELLRPENRRRLFPKDAPVFTKERDDMPARYGLSAQVKNSLVADGCTIEGTVENCILFKGVSVGKGAVVRNAILMQDSVISAGACLSYVITDKNVTIRPGGELCGAPNYPLSLPKGTMV